MNLRNYTEYIWAGDPSTPLTLFEYLTRFEDDAVRRRTAESDRCSEALLSELAHDVNAEVRMAVCHNEMTPLSVLEMLASDASPTVRYSLATNHRLPRQLLERLKEDENPYVACRAARTVMRLCESSA